MRQGGAELLERSLYIADFKVEKTQFGCGFDAFRILAVKGRENEVRGNSVSTVSVIIYRGFFTTVHGGNAMDSIGAVTSFIYTFTVGKKCGKWGITKLHANAEFEI